MPTEHDKHMARPPEDHPPKEPLVSLNASGPLAVLERALFNLLRFFAVTCLLLLLVGLTWTMIRRQIGGIAVPDEFVMLLFTWMVFVGAAALTRDWNHIDVPIVQEFTASRRWRLIHHGVLLLLSLFFIWIYFRAALGLVAGAANRTSPMLQLPQVYWYASLVVSAVLMGFYVLLRGTLVIAELQKLSQHDEVAP